MRPLRRFSHRYRRATAVRPNRSWRVPATHTPGARCHPDRVTDSPIKQQGHASAISRRDPPELCETAALKNNGGRREGRVPTAPMVRVQKKSTRQNHRYGPNNRPSLRDGFTAYTRSPWGPALLPPAQRVGTRCRIAPAPGRQDHTISPCASGLFVGANEPRCKPTRPSHPASHVRDGRETPLLKEAGRANSCA